MEWKETKLGDLIYVKHGYAFKGTHITKNENDKVLVTPGHFAIGGGWKPINKKFYDGEIPEDYVLTAGDVVVTMTDLSKGVDTLGYSALVPTDNEKIYLHNQRIGLVEFLRNEEEYSPEFLYWLMQSPEYRWHIVSSATGSTVHHTSPSRIYSYLFECPPIGEQREIARTLSLLDAKIDLLRQQNETLEALGAAVFREWFLGGDWLKASLYDQIELIGGGTPKTSEEEFWGGEIGWLSGGDIASNHKGYVSGASKTVTKEGVANSSAKLLPRSATIISARGTVGKYCLLAEPMTFSQSNYGVMPADGTSFYFTYLLIDHAVDRLLSAAYGSVFDTITTRTFKNLKLPAPPVVEVQKFEQKVSSFFEKMETNTKSIKKLIESRDLLLPKLMSGKVKIAE